MVARQRQPPPQDGETAPVQAQGLRIAVVVQRYGLEINGGAESLARQIAERLALRHAVDVITTCALDYRSWDMRHAPGEQRINGVTVRRFAHPPRVLGARLPKPHRLRFRLRRLLSLSPNGAAAHPRGDSAWDGLDFLHCQGPHSPELLRFLTTQFIRYDCGIFFTAQYGPTALGLPLWRGPSILVPTLHEEKLMMIPQFRRVFEAAGSIFYLTAAEQALAARFYGSRAARGEVVSVGIAPRAPSADEIAQARQRHRLPARYIVYVGRIDSAKGCDALLAAFTGHVRGADPGLGLVLVGQRFMDLQADERVVTTGFVTDEDRNAIVAGSLGLVLPSRFESLSMVLLEALALGVPVLANGHCEVLADHVRRSRGGLLYRTRRELGPALLRLAALPPDERTRIAEAGRAYVAENYDWSHVMARYEATITRLVADARAAPPTQPSEEAAASTASSQPRSTTAGS